jgi:serine/threonine protein kinase
VCGYSTTDDIENEANAVAALCSGRKSKYVVEVIKHGWLTMANVYYFIDMEYCPETLEDRLNGWKQSSDRDSTTQKQDNTRRNHIQQTAQVEVVSDVVSKADVGQDVRLDIDWDPVLAIFLDITKGLSYIHNKGFVHRDLKPKNGKYLLTTKY